MSVADRLVAFFVAPARADAPRPDTAAVPDGVRARDLPTPLADNETLPDDGPRPAVSTASSHDEADAIPVAGLTPAVPRSVGGDFAHSSDGTAARRLAPVPEPERRPVLRLVSPGELPESVAVGASGAITGPSSRVASTAAPVEVSPDPAVEPEPPGDQPLEASVARPGTLLPARTSDAAPRVCVLGDGRAVTVLARALASRLARDPVARCAVLCHVRSAPPGGPAAGPACPRPSARRLARSLTVDGLPAAARGRLVELVLRVDADPEAELERLVGAVGGLPLVTAMPATRAPELDPLLAGHDLVLLAVSAATPDALTELALTGLAQAAPGALVRSVTLPPRFGPGPRRAAVDDAMETLR